MQLIAHPARRILRRAHDAIPVPHLNHLDETCKQLKAGIILYIHLVVGDRDVEDFTRHLERDDRELRLRSKAVVKGRRGPVMLSPEPQHPQTRPRAINSPVTLRNR